MDLMLDEYGSDGNDDADNKPAPSDEKDTDQTSQNSNGHPPKKEEEAREEESPRKPSAVSTTAIKQGDGRKCSACDQFRSRKDYSKNQWGKGSRCRCKDCINKSHGRDRPTTKGETDPPPPKKQKKEKKQKKKKRRPGDVEVLFFGVSGPHIGPIYINHEETIGRVKAILAEEYGGVCVEYLTLTIGFPPRRMKSQDLLTDYPISWQKTNRIFYQNRKPPTRADVVQYFTRPATLADRFEENNPFKEMQGAGVRSLIGDYDIVCDWGMGATYEAPLSPLPESSLQIRPLGGQPDSIHIEGTISGCCTFRNEWSKGSFTSEWMKMEPDVSSISFNADVFSASFMMETAMLTIKEQIITSDAESDEDEYSEGEELRGGILVFNERVALPRRDLAGARQEFTCERGEELMAKYNDDVRQSWLCTHLELPMIAVENIWSFWRTEPLPSLFFEKDDILFSLYREIDLPLQGVLTDFCAVARRRRPSE